MHHTDTDADFIYRKLEAIVDCYLDPQIPTEPPPEKVFRDDFIHLFDALRIRSHR